MDSIAWFFAALVAIPIVFYLLTFIGERIPAFAPEEFPPISDEEFLARCKPGTKPEVALKVRAIVAYQLSIEEARIYPERRLVEDLRAD
ncbi:MAG: hypothetical protein AB8G99_04885 [Planctomycetaceae bacterium]